MAGTKGEESIIEGHEEIGGRKRVNEDKDTRAAKRAKVKGEAAFDGTEEEEEEVNNKLERLRGLLVDDPKQLSKKDVEEIINHLNVYEIISLALEANQGKRSDADYDDGAKVEEGTEDEIWDEKALKTVGLMLCNIEDVGTADIREAYEKWPSKAFATVLLSSLDALDERNLRGPLRMMEHHDFIPKLCSVLPWKLFAYVLYEKGVISFGDEEDEEELSRLQKEAAEKCGFCNGKGAHTGIYGAFCNLMDAVPKGTTAPPGYWIECSRCQYCDFEEYFDGCFVCDCEVGQAVRIPPSFRN